MTIPYAISGISNMLIVARAPSADADCLRKSRLFMILPYEWNYPILYTLHILLVAVQTF